MSKTSSRWFENLGWKIVTKNHVRPSLDAAFKKLVKHVTSIFHLSSVIMRCILSLTLILTKLHSQTFDWPLVIGATNIFWNSFFEPSSRGLTKSTIVQYSIKLFWSGVPVRITRRFVRIFESAFESSAFSFLILCPSSHITRSANIIKIKVFS